MAKSMSICMCMFLSLSMSVHHTCANVTVPLPGYLPTNPSTFCIIAAGSLSALKSLLQGPVGPLQTAVPCRTAWGPRLGLGDSPARCWFYLRDLSIKECSTHTHDGKQSTVLETALSPIHSLDPLWLWPCVTSVNTVM